LRLPDRGDVEPVVSEQLRVRSGDPGVYVHTVPGGSREDVGGAQQVVEVVHRATDPGHVRRQPDRVVLGGVPSLRER
jgi:hypothetical protein